MNKEYLGFALNLADDLENKSIRVDIDDRDETLSRRIRDAEREWVPYIVVVGQKEASSSILTVRVRGKGQVQMSKEELIELLQKETSGFPKRPLYMPRLLSQRPSYKQL
mgnify:FL=1